MSSTRLPGKVLKKILGKPLLQYQIERLKRVQNADQRVIATTENEVDEPIIGLCQRLAIAYSRGSEKDVLERYYRTAKQYAADVVVRVTSDCPLIDPQVIDESIQFYLNHRDEYDYVSNFLKRTYPRGMENEVFSFQALNDAFSEAKTPFEREHVTPFIHQHPERFRLGGVTYGEDRSRHRWTVDTAEDFELIKRMLEALVPSKPAFTLKDCLGLISRHPEWNEINAHIP